MKEMARGLSSSGMFKILIISGLKSMPAAARTSPAIVAVTIEEKTVSVNSSLFLEVNNLETTETVPTVSALAMTMKMK